MLTVEGHVNSQLFLFARLKNALLPAETVRLLSKLWTVSLKRNNKNISFSISRSNYAQLSRKSLSLSGGRHRGGMNTYFMLNWFVLTRLTIKSQIKMRLYEPMHGLTALNSFFPSSPTSDLTRERLLKVQPS